MVPPKSYADMVRGARKSPPPPPKATPALRTAAAPPLAALPVLSPSSSFSAVLPAEIEAQPKPPQQRGATGQIRSYAAAVKGTYSRPSSLPPPSPTPLIVEMEDTHVTPSAHLSAHANSSPPSPSPSPVPWPEPERQPKPDVEPEADSGPAGISLWETGRGHDVVIICGEARWYVHRYVLLRMSKFMETYLPPERGDGRPVVWNLNRSEWQAPMLSNVLRFMYVEEYDNCDFNHEDPLETEFINVNVNHFIAGASVHCRPMMDYALSRLGEATEEMREVADVLRHARLDHFQHGIRRAHLSMWAQPDQWRLLSLRIVMGKLMAVALPIILQSPHWTARYRQLWGSMHLNVVADNMWLHTAGFCPHVPAITKGFQHMQVMWVKYRPNGWRLEDDFTFPEGKADAPPPPSPPPTPHRSAKQKSKAVPTLHLNGTIDPSQAVPGSGPRDQGKAKNKGNKKDAEEAVAGTSDEAKPPAAAGEITEAGPSPIDGPPPCAGPPPAATVSAIMLDRPMPVGFSPSAGPSIATSPLAHQAAAAAVPAWVWPQTHQPNRPLPPFAPGFLPPSPSSFSAYPASSSASSKRPSSSGQLSATAEPFVMPQARAAATEPSVGGCSSSASRISSPVLGSPNVRRMAELYVAYGPEESIAGKDTGKDRERNMDKDCAGGLDTTTA